MDNKEIIISKALNLFAQKGYDAVGVKEICEASGVTKPTLYHYFTNKRGLLESLFKKFYPPFLEEVSEAMEYHHDIVLNLEALAAVFFRFAETAPDFNRFSLTALFSPTQNEVHEVQKQYSGEIHRQAEELFRLATEDHGNMRGKQKQLGLSFIGLLRSYIGLFLGNELTLDKTTTRAMVKQFMHGIFS